jgi:UDP-N-acetylglucosamine 2-epimerase (non-hydrolysing)
MTMPEEINRIVTDSITDYFFTTSRTANENLLKIGTPKENIFFVGNIMIDTLLSNNDRLKKPELFDQFNLHISEYIVLTMHRPANVDETSKLKIYLDTLANNIRNLPIVFPVHPRTAKTIRELDNLSKNILFVEPLGYLEFVYLIQNAKAVITDSGGITEEATVLGIPCMTLRDNTERPETVELGSNELVGTKPENLVPYLEKLFNNKWKKGQIPELWDGRTAGRIVDVLADFEKKIFEIS